MLIKKFKKEDVVVTLSSDSKKTIFTIKAVHEGNVVYKEFVDMIPFLFDIGVAQDEALKKAQEIFKEVVENFKQDKLWYIL